MGVKRLLPAPVRYDRRFSAIVLAAGAGRRFGGDKLTTPFRGGLLLDGALRAAFAAPAAEVLVVTGADLGVGPAATSWAERMGEASRLRMVMAHDWRGGLSASLRAGLEALGETAQAAFVFLGDMPDVPDEAAWRVARAWAPDLAGVEPVRAGEPAHPALLGRSLWAAARALDGDRGARALLQRSGPARALVELESQGATADVDTREALARLEG